LLIPARAIGAHGLHRIIIIIRTRTDQKTTV
jgi:hypothetical protein